jgi:hypothetical protein
MSSVSLQDYSIIIHNFSPLSSEEKTIISGSFHSDLKQCITTLPQFMMEQKNLR